MRSHDKIDVMVERVKTDDGEKPWAVVRDRRKPERPVVLVPSFEDMHRINLAIVHCEKAKYQRLTRDPAEMVRRFYIRSIDESVRLLGAAGSGRINPTDYESSWQTIASEFFMPGRIKAPRGGPTYRAADPLSVEELNKEFDSIPGNASGV